MATNNNRNCVNYRCSTDHINSLTRIAATKSAGASLASEVYFLLLGRTMDELRGMFTASELIGLVHTLDGEKCFPELMVNKFMFSIVMQDRERMEGAFSRFMPVNPNPHSGNANVKNFFLKLDKLTAAQCYFLQLEISIFWKAYPSGGAPMDDIKEFIKKFM